MSRPTRVDTRLSKRGMPFARPKKAADALGESLGAPPGNALIMGGALAFLTIAASHFIFSQTRDAFEKGQASASLSRDVSEDFSGDNPQGLEDPITTGSIDESRELGLRLEACSETCKGLPAQ